MHVYLFADARASINTHHPESQWFRKLLALLCDLQSQLSGWSHDHSCVREENRTITNMFSQQPLDCYYKDKLDP